MEEFNVLLILMVVIWTVGKLFRALKLPVIFGELIGGVLVVFLGPMYLNVDPTHNEVIKVIAELGVFFLMLHSGLETDPKELLKGSKKSFLIAVGGILLPFFASFFVARAFGVDFNASFIIGIATSISSIPITARIFKDCKIQKHPAARTALGSAIFEDIFALILFSIVLNLAGGGSADPISILLLLGKIIAFFVIVIYGGLKLSPYLNRVIKFKNKGFTFTLIIALLMGMIAEAIQLDMIIGAFLAGLFIREEVIDEKTFAKIEDRVYGLSYSFFGPIFFASLAFYLDFTALGTSLWLFIILIVIGIAGKIIGSGGIAMLLKHNKIESLLIGLAMNNRGALELVIAERARQVGIIDNNIFSILVMMAFATTIVSLFSIPPLAKKLKPSHA